MAILFSIVIVLFIVFSTCYNMVDRWRFRADRHYPYVKEVMEEWETVTLRLLTTLDREIPAARITGQKHAWTAAEAANRLAEACPRPDPENPVTDPLFTRQSELAEELELYAAVYNDIVKSHNKTLSRPIVRQVGELLKWTKWEDLILNPHAR